MTVSHGCVTSRVDTGGSLALDKRVSGGRQDELPSKSDKPICLEDPQVSQAAWRSQRPAKLAGKGRDRPSGLEKPETSQAAWRSQRPAKGPGEARDWPSCLEKAETSQVAWGSQGLAKWPGRGLEEAHIN